MKGTRKALPEIFLNLLQLLISGTKSHPCVFCHDPAQKPEHESVKQNRCVGPRAFRPVIKTIVELLRLHLLLSLQSVCPTTLPNEAQHAKGTEHNSDRLDFAQR